MKNKQINSKSFSSSSSSSSSSEAESKDNEIDLEAEEEEEEEEDVLDAPDFPAQFLQSTNWKSINIYSSIDEQQLNNHLLKQQENQQQLNKHLNQHHHQIQKQQYQLKQNLNSTQNQSQPIPLIDQTTSQKLTLDSIPVGQHQTNNFNSLSTPTPKPNTSKSTDRNLNPTSSQSPQLNNNSIHSGRYPPHPNQTTTPIDYPSTLTTTVAEATWGTGVRSNSRASIQPTSTNRSKPPTSIPTTHRSRMGSSDDHNTPTIIQRHRRVSDGSINGGVRKDMLLQRMAEALQSERAKAIVFQKELQNAEREIDELANTLDEQRRVHHKTIVSLKKDIKLLKKERENLVEALEAAEGVEQEEAERYLTLLDPAAQAVMVDDDEVDDQNDHQRHIKHSVPPHQPIFDDYDLSDYKSTIRAQMQERSALRAQRINSELLRINPSSSTDPNVIDSEKEATDQHTRAGVGVGGQQRQGRTRESTNRIRRKLSKTRPSSRDGNGGGAGLFWRRSTSRNRDMNEEKISSAPGTVYRHTDRRKVSAGNHTSVSHEDDNTGYYDSGPLQRSPHRSTSNGKIGKLFRKVFPTYKDDKDHQNQVDSEMAYNFEKNTQKNGDANAVLNRRRRSVLD